MFQSLRTPLEEAMTFFGFNKIGKEFVFLHLWLPMRTFIGFKPIHLHGFNLF